MASGTDGAHVQICRDRACVTVEQTIDGTGSYARLATALAPGTHFWRLYGRSGTAVGATAGPTWEFFVGHRSAAVDTNWGTLADFNGDGFTDVVVGAWGAMANTGRVYAYVGSATGLAPTPATALTGPVGALGEFGQAVASAGDVNGDGYADLVVGADQAMSVTGRAYVYLGNAPGLSPAPGITLTSPDGPGGFFGASVASAGNVNSYADLVASAGRAMQSRRGARWTDDESASSIGEAVAIVRRATPVVFGGLVAITPIGAP